MFFAFVLAGLSVFAIADNIHTREYYEQKFFDHVTKFGLKFTDGGEFIKRLQIFADNLDIIEVHNFDNIQKFKMGQNQFTHLTFDEFLDAVRIGGAIPPTKPRYGRKIHRAPDNSTVLADSVDWVKAGAVTDVKNQGSCGSCWAFSTTGALEGAYAIKYGDLISFSEQEIVSCDTKGNDAGCNGGWMDDAFEFVQNNGGITTESAYPYTSGTTGKTGTCSSSGYVNNPKVAPTGYVDVEPDSVTALMSAVAQQPVSIAIQANQLSFQMYSDGVLSNVRCGNRLDHGVLVTGYGTWTDGTPYWAVKNSWGDSWGMNGYILIERSDDDLCGVLDAPSYPELA